MRTTQKRLAVIAILCAVIFSFASGSAYCQSKAAEPDTSLAKHRAQRLRRGINLSEWFAQVYDQKGYTKEHFETWNTVRDIALIKAMGFDHVRLSVNPQPVWRTKQADHIPADYLAELDAAVKMILEKGLAVIIDVHPDSDFKTKLSTDSEFVEQFADYWRALAQHYASWDPEAVFFEVLNEPEARDPYRWYGVQARLATAIREGAPKQTIIAAGARWSDDDDLVFMQPVSDANVIYNFHFYEPHLFTHQGATWGENYWHWLKNLPYPSTPENVKDAAALVPYPEKRLSVERYGMQRWNAARMDEEFAQIAAWGEHWNVPLTCNEFGVYRQAARPEDRAAWIRDVRSALEKNGIGWTMWDYSGGFGVVTKQNGEPVPDEVTVKALGLKMPGR